MSTEVRVPTLGESVTEATVATWFKQTGDAVAADEMLCELETDKVTVEVPAPAAGTLTEIVAGEGETVSVDALLATIAEGDAKPAVNGQDSAAPAAQGSDEQPAEQGGEQIDIMVPTLGESVTEATVSTWFKQSGDQVERDEMLCELETDKVSVEVPAPASGTLGEILAPEGSTVEAGGKLALMSSGPDGAAPKPAEAAPAPTSGGGKDVEHAPSAKKMMAEKGLSPEDVQGSGRDGRIMKEDVQRAATAPKPTPPAPQPPKPAPAPMPPARPSPPRMRSVKNGSR
ncbi:Dihydrolipoamide succinyltransferase component (E2) of 2-oxoglutarate dehydrogenase complex [Rhodovulum sp. P5]|uniref:biotin/lipoyl-containing protein n=1 Tax=Rhodovulum sp. P5 TaxID=1564506 RepID=UPI0009C1F9F6|nr:Dihydrolipoamide succinyltransferase component (E2) of 2-oxoglutarate dehydrogenase complex [Rhodovulum sp. P5]